MNITKTIKNKANSYGFQSCGISKSEFLKDHAPYLEKWLKNNSQGEMNYMENNFDKRLDPRLLVEGSKSIISLSYNYFPEEIQAIDTYKVAKYAYGKDYHKVIKKKLKLFIKELQEEIGYFNARVFVDSAPILEKAWAEKSGIGWVGKNGNLITPKKGSFYFLAEIICDLELEYDNPIKDYCGTCTKCIDACPTNAIESPKVVNGSKCISYFTIELKNEIPNSMKGTFEDWMFGCDICQDVCPWNRFSLPHREPSFAPTSNFLSYSKKDWEEITEEVFNSILEGSAIKRTKFSGLKRNITFLKDKLKT